MKKTFEAWYEDQTSASMPIGTVLTTLKPGNYRLNCYLDTNETANSGGAIFTLNWQDNQNQESFVSSIADYSGAFASIVLFIHCANETSIDIPVVGDSGGGSLPSGSTFDLYFLVEEA